MHEREGLLYSSREERLGHEFDILVGPRQGRQRPSGTEGILEVGGGRPGNKCAVQFFSMSSWRGTDLQWLSTPTPSEARGVIEGTKPMKNFCSGVLVI